jgi:hypothetical protein
MAVTSYTPTKNYPSFSTIVNQYVNPVAYSTAGNVTYTAADVLGGFIQRDTNGGARTDVLPTATLLIPAIEGAQVGSSIKLLIKNTASAANTLTVSAGTGGTMKSGDTATVAQSNIKEFLIVVTAIPDQYGNGGTYTVYSLGTSVF